MLWHSHDTGPPVIHVAEIGQNATEFDDPTRIAFLRTQLSSEHQRRRHFGCSKKYKKKPMVIRYWFISPARSF